MATAAAASAPEASTTPRRVGPSPPGDGSVSTPVVDTVEPPQRGGSDRSGDQGRYEVQRPGARAQDGQHSRDAGQAHQDQESRGLAAGGDDAGDGGQQQHDQRHRADQHQLVGAAELPDGPLLERGGREVDDGRADGEHRRRRRHGQRRDQVGGGETDDGGEHAVRRVAQGARPGPLVGGVHGRCSVPRPGWIGGPGRVVRQDDRHDRHDRPGPRRAGALRRGRRRRHDHPRQPRQPQRPEPTARHRARSPTSSAPARTPTCGPC